MLPCITGSWKEIGGGLQLSTSDAPKLNKAALARPDFIQKALGRPARTVNMVELGQALNTLDNPPIKAMLVYSSNPAAVCPNHNDVIRGLLRPDLFTVVHEQFFTDTTDYADIVLPATTFFENKDLVYAYGHYYLQMSHQAIEPLGECRSNVETFRALAQRMGLEEECFEDSVDQMIDAALNSGNPWLKGIDRERLEREGHVRLNFGAQLSAVGSQLSVGGSVVDELKNSTSCNSDFLGENQISDVSSQVSVFLPFARGNFPTASGKAELYSEALKAQGLDPVVEFTPPQESRHSEQAKAFPLELLARKADNFLNTTFCNLPVTQDMEEPGLLEMNVADAKERGITDGAPVRVFNRRGEIILKARVDGAVQAGVVSARLNWAKLHPQKRNINVLTSEKLTDLGNSATFYSVLVEVELSQTAS